MHGPHQVAQKSTTSTWPCRLFDSTVAPVVSRSLNAGAGPSAAGAPLAQPDDSSPTTA